MIITKCYILRQNLLNLKAVAKASRNGHNENRGLNRALAGFSQQWDRLKR